MDCKFCENTGIQFKPNGLDDFDKEYCTCEKGAALENPTRTLKVRALPDDYTTCTTCNGECLVYEDRGYDEDQGGQTGKMVACWKCAGEGQVPVSVNITRE